MLLPEGARLLLVEDPVELVPSVHIPNPVLDKKKCLDMPETKQAFAKHLQLHKSITIIYQANGITYCLKKYKQSTTERNSIKMQFTIP